MKKRLLVILIMGLVLFTGCVKVNDNSDKICTGLKHSINDENISIFMDNDICIIEAKDWNISTIVDCKVDNFIQVNKATIIFKDNKKVTKEMINIKGAKCTYV